KSEGLYLFGSAQGGGHVIKSKVNLALHAIRLFWHHGIIPYHFLFKDIVLGPHPMHKVKNRLLTHHREVLVMFLQPVVHLGRRGVVVGLQFLAYKLGIRSTRFLSALVSRSLIFTIRPA